MNRIRALLKDKNISISELAHRLSIAQPTMSKMLSGKPSLTSLEKIATALGVPVSALVEDNPPLILPPDIHEIPVYASIRAGNGESGSFVGEKIDTIMISEEYKKQAIFAIRVSGDSMLDELRSGDYALFRPYAGICPSSDEICAVEVSDWPEWAVKYIEKDPSGLIILRSANPAYKNIELDPDERTISVRGILIESGVSAEEHTR